MNNDNKNYTFENFCNTFINKSNEENKEEALTMLLTFCIRDAKGIDINKNKTMEEGLDQFILLATKYVDDDAMAQVIYNAGNITGLSPYGITDTLKNEEENMLLATFEVSQTA